MAKQNKNILHQPSFAAGEVGPDLWGRVDQELYYIGVRTLLNMVVSQYGGALNRPGTTVIGETKHSGTRSCRLIRFSFNDIQTYMLEFGHQYFRVIKDGGYVTDSTVNITAITKANPAVVTSAAHGLSNGQDVYLDSIVGMVELNGRFARVANVAANTFELTDYQGNNINSTNYTTYASGGTASRLYTVTHTIEEADLQDLNFAQSNDVLTIAHNNYHPKDVTRTGHSAWTITDFDNQKGPFKDINATATTLQASAATGSVTITASASLFTAAMVGDLVYIEQGPDDLTKAWEAGKNIRSEEIRRSGPHFYQAETITGSATVSGVSIAALCIVTTSAAHGLVTGDYVYITGVGGTTEINNQWYYVKKITNTTFYIMNDQFTTTYTDSSGWTAFASNGTAEKGKQTGATKPDWTEGTQVDGDPGIAWTYLHSGFGIVEITGYTNATTVTATVIDRLPANVVSTATDVWALSAWSDAEGYPQAITYHKRRLWFGATTQQSSTLWGSGIGLRTDFSTSNPLLDDEAITLGLETNDMNAIRHLLPLKDMIALTSSSEQLIKGDSSGAVLATEPPNPEVQGYTGASKVMPIIIGNTALFVQDMGSTVQTLQYQLDTDSFGGINLSARSPHIFEDKTIVSWSYQRHPMSVIWCVFDDGSMAGLTFVNEQRVYAWHRHATGVDGEDLWEDVSSIREGNETATYCVVNRQINGVTKRFVERFHTRRFSEVRDAFFVDCGQTYDGRNTGAVTMTITGGTNWDNTEALTVTASSSTFKSTDVGNAIVFWSEDDDGVAIAYRLTITAYTSATVVTAYVDRTISDTAYRGAARTDWEFAKKKFYAWHLNGMDVAVLADGNVIDDVAVANGFFTLDTPAAVVHVGIGYTADFETLEMAQPQGNTRYKTLAVPRVVVTVKDTVGLKVGVNGLDKVKLAKQRTVADGYDAATPLKTGHFDVLCNTSWSQAGRICIRQDKPLPLHILSVSPEVILGSD